MRAAICAPCAAPSGRKGWIHIPRDRRTLLTAAVHVESAGEPTGTCSSIPAAP
jgi:hypothetical protein